MGIVLVGKPKERGSLEELGEEGMVMLT